MELCLLLQIETFYLYKRKSISTDKLQCDFGKICFLFNFQAMSRTSSYSSITDSTMSLNIITVTLNMDTVNFLGISIVGQSNKGGDGGIYVGSIMKG